jgi:hypothetical protein
MNHVSEPPWLPLLRQLTSVDPAWGVWKNADRALEGEGDIDSVAPKDAWPALVDEFRRWARESRIGPVVACSHAPGTLVVVGCAGRTPTRLLQLDVYERVAGVADASALEPVMEKDPRGFRRLRPGAEGLLLLLAITRRGARRPRSAHDLERVAQLVTDDPDGARCVASCLGDVGPRALAGATAVAAGRWDRRPMLALEFGYLVRALRDPRPRAAWLAFVLRGRRRCPVLLALARGRVVPGDLAAWLDEVARSHRVYTSA